MKLRSMICLSALATAFAAFGTAGDVVVSGSTCAAMAVPASGTYTFIAVPFKDVAGAANSVKVVDLVKTIGLKQGSKLYYYNGTSFYVWNLAADNGTWSPVSVTCKKDGKDVTSVTPETGFAISTGSTLFLERASGSDESVTLYGEDVAAGSATITGQAMSLISNPKQDDKTISDAGQNGDKILIPNTDGTFAEYTYNSAKGGWGDYSGSTTVGGVTIKKFVAKSPVIPGGRGAWYVSKSATVPTIAW